MIDDPHYWYGWDGDRLVTTEHAESRVHTIYEPTSFTPLIRLEQPLPLPEAAKGLGNIMEAEMADTGIKLPKQVKERFDRVEKEMNAGNLSEEMQHWLAGMQLTEEQIKEDFLPEKSEKQTLIKHYYHTDQIGTPLALVNEMGEIDWEIIIDPYGNRVREENPKKLCQPIRMQGQQYDIESGLHYNRHRYYDPKQGRYISQDPIGLQGGINNYVYPLNPNQAVDPLGLWAFIPGILGPTTGIGASGGVVGSGGVVQPEDVEGAIAEWRRGRGWRNSTNEKLLRFLLTSSLLSRAITCFSSSGDNDPCDKKLDDKLLRKLGINRGDAHYIKKEYMGAGNNSQYDMCGCKDGQVVIKARGCKGSEPGEKVYEFRWK